MRYAESDGPRSDSANAPGDGNGAQDLSGEPDQPRRQRRRLDADADGERTHGRSPSSTTSGRSHSPTYPRVDLAPKASRSSLADVYAGAGSREGLEESFEMQDDESDDDDSSEGGEDDLAIAVGQLSLNEDEQLRYHGKASGLHLLGVNEREDGRHEGGIWSVPFVLM